MRCASSRSARLLGVNSRSPTTVRSHFRSRTLATRRHLLSALPAAAFLVSCDSLPASGPTTSEIASAGRPGRSGGTRFALVDVTADTVAIMQNLDLVITSDTSIAHLAGALGVPVWVALGASPDWRWLSDRADSPWYPTMRLFRQSVWGRWDDVFAEMSAALAERIGRIGKREVQP